MTDAASAPTFEELEATHQLIDEYLLEHQDVLLDRQFEACRELFLRFDEATRKHIREEDTILYPLYQARVRAPAGGGLNLMHAEHRKIEKMNAEILEQIKQLPAQDHLARRAVVRLIEAEALLKHLLNHHHLREHSFLVPGLNAVTTPDERRRIFKQMEELRRQPLEGVWREGRKDEG